MAKSKSNKILKVVMPILLLGGGAAAAYGITKAVKLGTSAKKLSLDFKDVLYKGISSFVLNLDVRFNVVNPSNSKFTIDFISLDIKLPDGKTIAQIREPNFNKVIDKIGITTLTLSSKTNLLSAGLSLATELINYFTGKLPTLTIVGSIRANGFSFEVNEKFDLNSNVSGLKKVPVVLHGVPYQVLTV